MTSAQPPIRIGIIGTNFVSDWLCEAAETVPSVYISAVYSRTEARGSAFAAAHHIDYVFTDFQEFITSDLIDAVYIASPNIAHAEQAIGALSNGKHVLCEKIIATSSVELSAMIQEARKNHRILLEAMRPAFDPCIDLIRTQLPKLGTLRRAVFDYCQYSSRYDRFKNGEVLNAFDPSLSNAAVMDIGVYIVHMCAALFGRPSRITAMSTFLENGFEGAGHVLLDYGSMKAELSYSKITESVTPNIIMGEHGAITFGKITMPHDVRLCLRGEAPQTIPFTPAENNMIYELAVFADLIASGSCDHSYLQASIIALEIIDEIRRQNQIIFPNEQKSR